MNTKEIRIKQKADLRNKWLSSGADYVLLDREIAYEKDTNMTKMGDGITQYKDLPYRENFFTGGNNIIANNSSVNIGSFIKKYCNVKVISITDIDNDNAFKNTKFQFTNTLKNNAFPSVGMQLTVVMNSNFQGPQMEIVEVSLEDNTITALGYPYKNIGDNCKIVINESIYTDIDYLYYNTLALGKGTSIGSSNSIYLGQYNKKFEGTSYNDNSIYFGIGTDDSHRENGTIINGTSLTTNTITADTIKLNDESTLIGIEDNDKIAFTGSSISPYILSLNKVKPSALYWENQGVNSITGTVKPYTAALIPSMGVNRILDIPLDHIKVETLLMNSSGSSDGWIEKEITGNMIHALTNDYTATLYAGDKSLGVTSGSRLQITLMNPNSLYYTTIQKILIKVGLRYCTGRVEIATSTKASPDSYIEKFTSTINGDPAWNDFNFSSYFGSTDVNNIRLTFYVTSVSSNNAWMAIQGLHLIGHTWYQLGNNQSKDGLPYQTDYQQNCTFLGNITAQNFKGTASKAIADKNGNDITVTYLTENDINWNSSEIKIQRSMSQANSTLFNLSTNWFAYYPPMAIDVEYSIDGGTNWLDYNLSDEEKLTFFTPQTRETNFSENFGKIYAGGPTPTEHGNIDSTRITIRSFSTDNATRYLYCWLKRLAIRGSARAPQNRIVLQAELFNNLGTFVELTNFWITGQPFWCTINLSKLFGANSAVSSSNIRSLRIVIEGYNDETSLTSNTKFELHTCLATGNNLYWYNTQYLPGSMIKDGTPYQLFSDKSLRFMGDIKLNSSNKLQGIAAKAESDINGNKIDETYLKSSSITNATWFFINKTDLINKGRNFIGSKVLLGQIKNWNNSYNGAVIYCPNSNTVTTIPINKNTEIRINYNPNENYYYKIFLFLDTNGKIYGIKPFVYNGLSVLEGNFLAYGTILEDAFPTYTNFNLDTFKSNITASENSSIIFDADIKPGSSSTHIGCVYPNIPAYITVRNSSGTSTWSGSSISNTAEQYDMYCFKIENSINVSTIYTHLTVRMDNPSPNDVDLRTWILTGGSSGSLGG